MTVETGGAAEGKQFLRFIPEREDNALVLNLGPESGSGGTRSLQFSIRLRGKNSEARLVMSYGQMLALKPIADGVEIDPNADAGVIAVAIEPDVWLPIGIYEDLATKEWELFVDDKKVLSELAISDPTELLRELLVFSDGAIDLDAVVVVSQEIDTVSDIPDENAPGNKPDTPPGLEETPAQKQRDSSHLGKALGNAAKGNLASALGIINQAVSEDTTEISLSGRLGLELGILAFNLLEKGKREEASALAWQSLKNLEEASNNETETEVTLSGFRLLSGQICEEVFADFERAEEHYLAASEIDPKNIRAGKSAARARRKANGDFHDDFKIIGGES